MKLIQSSYSLAFLLLVMPLVSQAQQNDKNDRKPIKDTKLSRKIIGSITTREKDTTVNQRSEQAFIRYEGKIIRKIIIQKIGFERSIYDTTKRKIVNDATRLANSLHTNTRAQVIRDNLFIREKKPLDPYKLADNERYLRDLDFILDANILVKPILGQRDSVDVIVVTRDVFSLGGSVNPRGTDEHRFSVYDANLSGLGQRTQFTGVYDGGRDPGFGYQLLYSKNSVAGSLINATVSYTQLNNGASYGLENEQAIYLRLNRPLVSPYTRFAGGIELSQNWSNNVYNLSDTTFRNYQYGIMDFWVGYNIGIKNRTQNRNRHFVALRSFNQNFHERPVQPSEIESPIYNDKSFILGEVTFYNQNFYKTRYIYGFGRTEDVPYGRQLTLLAGGVKQFNKTRPYVGVEYEKSVVRKNGDFHTYTVGVGGFQENKELQDVLILTTFSFYSKLIEYKRLKIRQSLTGGYSAILNQTSTLPLRIDNEFGLESFKADSLIGNKRLGIKAETIITIPLTVLGFRFAPLAFAEMAMVAPKGQDLFDQKAYFSLGAGVRTRNENLVFGTIELRMYYFPRVTEDLSHFKVSLSMNIQRVKYSSGFVKAPAFIRYN